MEIVCRCPSTIASRPLNRIRCVSDPSSTAIHSFLGLVRARYSDPYTRTAMPWESRERAMSRDSPSMTSRNRMRTSRETLPTPCERPPGWPKPLDRIRRAGREAAVRGEGRGDRRNPLLPRSAALDPFRDPQVRDHRGPEIASHEPAFAEQRSMERQVRVDAVDLERIHAFTHPSDCEV